MSSEPTRRSLLIGGTAGAAGAALATIARPAAAATIDDAGMDVTSGAAPGEPITTPRIAGLHMQFGADPATEFTVSWHTLQPVRDPHVLVGGRGSRPRRRVAAKVRSYTDGASDRTVYCYHARVTGLRPDREFSVLAGHAGAEYEGGDFRTAPRGRVPFTFTSFGDQGTPTTGRLFVPPPGVTLPRPVFVNDNLGSPAGADVTSAIERVQPLFHLFNGDLCYANLATDRVRTWSDFWENTTRSARRRAWMPSAGNHENERGNGPIGYEAYQTFFDLPETAGQNAVTRGLWYAFTVGSVRVISLANDDICYQDAGDTYVRGYSQGAQRAWVERELAATRRNDEIDWIVVCMHQVAISTADGNGADLGVRQEWSPLFDRYGVDLVVCGHEHHYERSHPIRGARANATLTPIAAARRTDVVDTEKGTVHMILGGGGASTTSNNLLFEPPHAKVITAVSDEPDPATHHRVPVYVTEPAPWSAVRNAAHPYGFAAFDVDPGTRAGGTTTMTVTYYDVLGPEGQMSAFETFELRRRRRD